MFILYQEVTKITRAGVSRYLPSARAGFDGKGHDFLLDTTSVNLINEFLSNMRNPGYSTKGVLISGPNGVGKSGIGLLTVFSCAANGMPVVYIETATAWVHAAKMGNGDSFLLNNFFVQNADLILESDVLRPVFEAYIFGEELLSSSTMDRLTTALSWNTRFSIGIVVDDVQAITETVAQKDSQAAVDYFEGNWYNWEVRLGKLFNRMDIASSHGETSLHFSPVVSD